MLKINFQPYGNGAKKIERGEFAIRDRATRKVIDLSVGWNACFSPGRKVDMCMVFKGFRNGGRKDCPICHQTLPTQALHTRSKLNWWVSRHITEVLTLTWETGESGCGMTYQQVIPFRSIFEDKGRLSSGVFNTAEHQNSPECLLRPHSRQIIEKRQRVSLSGQNDAQRLLMTRNMWKLSSCGITRQMCYREPPLSEMKKKKPITRASRRHWEL